MALVCHCLFCYLAVEYSFQVTADLRLANRLSDGFHYEKAFGTASLDKDVNPALGADAIFWLASCTKLMTSVAAMQCVEQGLFTLDEDVCRFLPELKDIEILTSFDKATKKPILKKNTVTMTMRYVFS
jgi:CubicO group peptidase (beta-lactamase class C family)